MKDRLKHAESDRFLAALFAPPAARAGVLALCALDHELKRIPAIVSEPMLGAIRLQWWRDTLGAVYQGEQPGHEIVPTLTSAIRAGGLPAEAFHRWVDARECELDAVPFATMEDMELVARKCDGTIAELAALILTGGDSEPAAGDAGTVYGLCDMLRRLPEAARRGTCLLPAETLANAGASPDDVLAGNMTAGVRRATAEVATRIADMHRALPRVPVRKQALPALMPASLVPGYLRQVTDPARDLFRTPVALPAFRRQITLVARAVTGRI